MQTNCLLSPSAHEMFIGESPPKSSLPMNEFQKAHLVPSYRIRCRPSLTTFPVLTLQHCRTCVQISCIKAAFPKPISFRAIPLGVPFHSHLYLFIWDGSEIEKLSHVDKIDLHLKNLSKITSKHKYRLIF